MIAYHKVGIVKYVYINTIIAALEFADFMWQ